MIFLVGARRSGTNWLQRIVAAHPDVAMVPSETYLFSRGIKPLRERLHHGVLWSPGTAHVHMDPRVMAGSLRELCDRVFLPFLEAAPGRTRVAERTPEHVTCLDVIGEIYPDAHVVHIVRDGRDVARSLLGQGWRSAPGSMEEAAAEWRDCVEAGEAAGRTLERYRTVRYEAMLADPPTHVTELFAWLGLDASDPVVDGALIEAEVPFNSDPGAPAVGAGKWREEFTEADLATFMTVAGETLARLGYDTGVAPAERRESLATAPEPKRRRGLRRKAGAGADRDPGTQRALVAQLTENQRLLDRVVAAIRTRRLDDLTSASDPSVWIRVVAPGESWKGRGPAAWEKLAAVIGTDDALDGRQVDGDVHAGLPTSTALMTFAGKDGAKHLRVVAVSTNRGIIERIVYYRLPLAADRPG